MDTQITPLYAGILGLMLVALGIRAILLNPGDEAGEEIKRFRFDKGMQAFGNFTEYAPFALILIWWFEQQSGEGTFVHILCLGLLAGRLVHAFGVSQVNEKPAFRVAGMALTFIVITTVAVRLVLF
ncbi:MAPEG family protein [Candidatus Entotheonella palauensis]|uniref:Glutathione metabolism protein n=1 Tax=Candidatus Entotheonella gemina TaxID=1429439 RepID=W4MBI6_9BACT|nr:MAPEG family protein [Candidatus Entotheonella palauensis]ETX07261.1 MAG: hypothetical protein ETSY2_12200 [Candidatus Entotheonella gemina]